MANARVILIAGGSGALGQAVSAHLTQQHYQLVHLQRGNAQTAPQADAIGGVDFADQRSVQQAVAEAARQHGPLYALVNCIGGFAMQTLAEAELASWDDMYQRNLRPAVALTQAMLATLSAQDHGGRIVHIGAAASTATASAMMGPYLASKAGLLKLVEAAAAEHRSQRICVNAVLPGIIDTPANRQAMPDADPANWVTPTQIAELIGYLLSPAGEPISGCGIPITARS